MSPAVSTVPGKVLVDLGDGRWTTTSEGARSFAHDLLAAAAEAEPGGDMPDPWPGMGVEIELANGRGITRFLCDPVRLGNVWYISLVGCEALPKEGTRRLDEVTAIYDGRREIWRRA